MTSLPILFRVVAAGVLLSIGCTLPKDESEVVGVYVAHNYTNCDDTISLHPGGVYERRVYASNGTAVLRMRGKWELVDGLSVQFHSFFLDLDRDLLQWPELALDTEMVARVPLESVDGALGFCTGPYEGTNCYRKAPPE